jgi:glycosyltransferase involved in cell wall biosynthesis
MNIAINASIMDGHPTGIGWYTVNMVNAMFRQAGRDGHHFTLFTSESSLFTATESVRIRKIPKYVRSYEFKKFGAAFRFLWNQTVYTRAAGEFDLCYSPTHHCSLFIPQIITILDLIGLNFPHQHRLQHYYYKLFLPMAVSKAKSVITISEATKADVVKFMQCPEEKVRVITCGYDKGLYRETREATTLVQRKYNLGEYIMTVGATYPHKNLERLIESYSHLPGEMKDRYKLVVVGGMNDYGKSVQRIAMEKGIHDNIVFLGYVDSADLPLLYGAAVAMVYPSLYEGFGLPPLEAMACGCPVIVSQTSSLPEVGGDATYYVDPYDVESITHGLEEVLSSRTLRDELKHRGLARSKLFSWDEAARQLLTAIDG